MKSVKSSNEGTTFKYKALYNILFSVRKNWIQNNSYVYDKNIACYEIIGSQHEGNDRESFIYTTDNGIES